MAGESLMRVYLAYEEMRREAPNMDDDARAVLVLAAVLRDIGTEIDEITKILAMK